MIHNILNLRNIILLFLCFIVLAASPSLAFTEENPIHIMVDNEIINFAEGEQKPVLIKDKMYVSLRKISESLGQRVEWDKENKQILIKTRIDNIGVQPPVNNSNNIRILVDNTPLNIPEDCGQPFITTKGEILFPVKLLPQALNCEVNSVPGLIVINKKTTKGDKVAIANARPSERDKIEDIDFTNLSSITIMGPNIATREQLQALLDQKKSEIEGRSDFIPFPNLIDLYLEIGQAYGIRGDVAFCQALKETGYFQFTGLVKPNQNNYCGLWATGRPLTGEKYHNGTDPTKVFFIPGWHGLTFASPEYGVEAHIQHLYAYATTAPLPEGRQLYDPRFKYVKRGIAPTWSGLNGKWAVPGNGYGESIIKDYLLKALNN